MEPIVDIKEFIENQTGGGFSLATENWRKLVNLQRRTVRVGKTDLVVQHNPDRVRSTSAPVVIDRPCFLCRENRPADQGTIDFGDYQILINPFPICKGHLTIAHKIHQPQLIAAHLKEMAEIAKALPGFTVFYNGPRAGASAPDHLHFQAVESAELPLWQQLDSQFSGLHPAQPKVTFSQPAMIVFKSENEEQLTDIERIIGQLKKQKGEDEPKLNLLMRVGGDGRLDIVLIPRRMHRPKSYTSDPEDSNGFNISPASVEMAGIIVTPRKIDFDGLTADDIRQIYSQVGYSPTEIINMLKR